MTEKKSAYDISRIFRPLLAFLILLTILCSVFLFWQKSQQAKERMNYSYIAETYAGVISSKIDRLAIRSYTLKDMVADHKGDTGFFQTAAEEIREEMKDDTGIELYSVILAPEGVVTEVWPENEKKDLVGRKLTDMLKEKTIAENSGSAETDRMTAADDASSAVGDASSAADDAVSAADDASSAAGDAVSAADDASSAAGNTSSADQGGTDTADSRGAWASEPYELASGTIGMTVCTPVYVDTEDGEEFWGTAAVTADLASLLDSFDMKSLSDRQISYELWYEDGGAHVTLSSEGEPGNEAVTVPVEIAGLKWRLSIAPASGWYGSSIFSVAMAVLLLIVVLLGVVFWMMFRSYEARKAEVTEQEREERRRLEQAAIRRMDSILWAVAEDYVCLIDVNLETEREYEYILGSHSDRTLPRWSASDDYTVSIRDFANLVVAEEDRERFLQQTQLRELQHVLNVQGEFLIEYTAVIDGQRRHFQGRFTKSAGVTEAPHMYVGIRDLTDAEQIRFAEEKRLKEVYEAAEAANREKSRLLKELETARMEAEAARAEAEAANQAKSTFLFNMSHDIRTPMNAILGFAERLEKHADDPADRERYIRNILTSGRYLLDLINNVLEMARIESGKTVLDEEGTDLGSLCNDAFVVFSEDCRRKNLRLDHSVSLEHPFVLCDAVKCREILLNIISNSVKYTPEGGSVRVDIRELSRAEAYASPTGSTAYRFPAGSAEGGASHEFPASTAAGTNEFADAGESGDLAYYRFIVEDTGIGMAKEFLPHIFDSFTREKTVTENKVVGTGLGMGIVKKLIDLMHGTVLVESELGKGTRTTIILPFHIVDEVRTAPENEEHFDTTTLEGCRILLAEDNALNREIAVEVLEECGVKVVTAEDGIQCVATLEREPAGSFDVILMDIQMPNMNGLKAAGVIRSMADPAKASIPIIAMTANVFDEDRQKALNAGMDGFTGKPIEVDKLFAEISRLKGRSHDG